MTAVTPKQTRREHMGVPIVNVVAIDAEADTHVALVIAKRFGVISEDAITMCGIELSNSDGWVAGRGLAVDVACPDCRLAAGT